MRDARVGEYDMKIEDIQDPDGLKECLGCDLGKLVNPTYDDLLTMMNKEKIPLVIAETRVEVKPMGEY